MQPRPRILVVDDDEMIRRVYRNFLTAEGFDVHVAENGELALDLHDFEAFAAVVSDVAMPGINGIDLLRHIRAHAPDLPVILVSGALQVADATAAVELHAFRLLEKPVDARTLCGVLRDGIAAGAEQREQREAAATVASQRMVTSIHSALFDRGLAGIWMAYQPIVRASDGSVAAYEALLRTREPALASPLAFLSLAEELGRIVDIGRVVRRVGPGPFTDGGIEADLFINLHTADLDDETLYDPSAPLARMSSRVVLEITERASLLDVRDVVGRVARLRGMGYRIAVDDLGAGYSGLTAFALLEPEVAKLDMSLVRGVDGCETKQRLIRSMVGVAHEVGTHVVAEGVETIAERDTLVDLGCDLLQGYLFARPAASLVTPAWPARNGLDAAS